VLLSTISASLFSPLGKVEALTVGISTSDPYSIAPFAVFSSSVEPVRGWLSLLPVISDWIVMLSWAPVPLSVFLNVARATVLVALPI
jgi:hypothetical protein